METRAKFVEEIVVKDPDTGNLVEIEIYKHENGGMFGIDSSYLETIEDEGILRVPDMFSDVYDPNTLYLEEK